LPSSLVVADYGQVELVMLAHMIGKGKLFEGFHLGIDPHTMHAAGVLRKRPEDVTKNERQALGKTLGFTIVNGAGDKKVAQMAGVSLERGRKILADYDKEFPEVPAFKRKQFALARSRRPPYLTSPILGRKRRLPELLSDEKWRRERAERQAFNYLIQGGAADLMKIALVRADRLLQEHRPEAYLSLTVHDEMVAVSPDEFAEEVKALIEEAMVGEEMQKLLRVPLKTEALIVKRWADAK